MSEKDGGPAFPQISTEIGQQYEPHISSSGGISKLEWFAGQIIQGMAVGQYSTPNNPYWAPEDMADAAYDLAEAMLAESEKRKS